MREQDIESLRNIPQAFFKELFDECPHLDRLTTHEHDPGILTAGDIITASFRRNMRLIGDANFTRKEIMIVTREEIDNLRFQNERRILRPGKYLNPHVFDVAEETLVRNITRASSMWFKPYKRNDSPVFYLTSKQVAEVYAEEKGNELELDKTRLDVGRPALNDQMVIYAATNAIVSRVEESKSPKRAKELSDLASPVNPPLSNELGNADLRLLPHNVRVASDPYPFLRSSINFTDAEADQFSAVLQTMREQQPDFTSLDAFTKSILRRWWKEPNPLVFSQNIDAYFSILGEMPYSRPLEHYARSLCHYAKKVESRNSPSKKELYAALKNNRPIPRSNVYLKAQYFYSATERLSGTLAEERAKLRIDFQRK